MNTISLSIIGKNIRNIRIKRKISQEELSFRTELHRTYIGKLERGEANVSVETLIKIAKALNIDLDDIFEKPEEWKK